MVSITQMRKYTPAKIKVRTVKTVKRSRLVKAVFDIDEKGSHQKAMFKVVATTIPRRVEYRIYGDPQSEKTIIQRPTWVHCSCEWFTFFCEYALAKRRSSSIINSNGQPSKVTNPRMWPYVCKHIIATIDKLSTVKFKQPRVQLPSKEELEFILREVDKYIPKN